MPITKARSARARSTLTRAAPFALLLALGLFADWASFSSAERPLRFTDTNMYERSARLPILSRAFFVAERPPTASLVYKLVDSDPLRVAWGQSLISVLSWFGLGLALAWHLRARWLRIAAPAASLLLSLALPIQQWDFILLGESLSFSFLALSSAATLVMVRFAAEKRRLRALVICGWALVCLLFAWTRDSNIYSLALLGAGLSGWLGLDWLGRRRDGTPSRVRRSLVLAIVLLAPIVVGSHVLMRASPRWRTPLLNVLLGRVIRRPALYRDFRELYGMPRNLVFESYKGRKAWTPVPGSQPIRDRLYWSDDPALADIRAWVLERGASSYTRYLVWDGLGYSLEHGRNAFVNLVSSRSVEREYGRRLARASWLRSLTAVVYFPIPAPMIVNAAMILAAALLAWRSARRRWLFLIAVFLAINAWAQAFVAFHGDTSHVARHIVLSGASFRLALLTLALGALDLLRRDA